MLLIWVISVPSPVYLVGHFNLMPLAVLRFRSLFRSVRHCIADFRYFQMTFANDSPQSINLWINI